MTDEQTDAVASVPTRRSLHPARPVPPPLPQTEPVGLIEAGDTASDTGPAASPELAWAPPAPRRPPALGGWALTVAITGLAVSLVVGWGFPIGIIAIITAIVALRQPGRRRRAAGWALALGVLSILYSALWILVAVNTGALF